MRRKNEAIAVMKERYPLGTDFIAQECIPEFANGTLYRVSYTSSNKEALENYVYFCGNDNQIFTHARDAIQEAAKVSRPKNTVERILNSVLRIGGLPGIIALIITVTICIIIINPSNSTQSEVPEFLKSALAIILGFYFGVASNAPKNESDN